MDGVDVWTNGDPPRKFQLLGIIDDQRPGGIIPMAEMKHDIAKKAREHATLCEARIFQIAHAYEQSTDWHKAKPQI